MRLPRPALARPAPGTPRRPVAVVAVAALLALSACGDDGTAEVTAGAGDAVSPDPTPSATVDEPVAPPTSEPSPTGDASSAPAGGEAGAPPAPAGSDAPAAPAEAAAPFEADLRPDSGEPEGHGLTVTDVAVGVHEGYDRVVFTLDGQGVPGWHVAYVDQPTRQGSGEPFRVAGAAFLSVLITGVGYPFDTGIEEFSGREITPTGTEVVREVEVQGTFEGQYDAAVGLTDTRGFRVFRLDAPPRVVIDVLHAG